MDLQALSFGLYIHVPFCSNACAYCNFYKTRPTRQEIQKYLEGIKKEFLQHQELLSQKTIQTIFIGGGSPSSLSTKDLESLLSIIKPWAQQCLEWTIEVSPVSINLDKLACMKAYGVNRISMGTQSFQPTILELLGRRQTPEQAYQAYEWIRQNQFQNVNLDLIFPPNFGHFPAWQKDLETMVQLAPEHISTYCLSYEKDTGPFAKETPVNEEQELKFYQYTWQFLETQGYHHYEISNFAKPGFSCKHNKNTWKMQEWLGFGPSAASQIDFKRYRNPYSIDKWIQNIHEDITQLSLNDLLVDCLIFGLRTIEGVNLQKLKKRFTHANLQKYEPLWQQLKDLHLCVYDKEFIRCTDQGLLVADAIAQAILEVE